LQYKAHAEGIAMKNAIPRAAWMQLLLVSPAVLFFAALWLRAVQPLLGTGQVVAWYSGHTRVGLLVFLVGMPLAALGAGSALLYTHWQRDIAFRRDALIFIELARRLRAPLRIALATLLAAAALVLVALHLATE